MLPVGQEHFSGRRGVIPTHAARLAQGERTGLALADAVAGKVALGKAGTQRFRAVIALFNPMEDGIEPRVAYELGGRAARRPNGQGES